MADNTYSVGYKTFVTTRETLQAQDPSKMTEAELKEHKDAIEAAQNPIGNFGRLLSTYNLKGGALAGLTYGAFVFGLGPVGLALAGAASFMLSKFAATHYAAYKEVAKSNQFSKLEGSYFEMAKTASKNVGQFLANSTYRSAVLSMNESAIAKTDEDASFYQLGTTLPDNSGFDSKTLGVDLIAGLASVLALAYAPISAPLAMATLPVLTASTAYGYVNNYLKKGASLGEGTDKGPSNGPAIGGAGAASANSLERVGGHADQAQLAPKLGAPDEHAPAEEKHDGEEEKHDGKKPADQANAMELADGIANQSAAAIANGDELVGADQSATGSLTYGGSRESGE